MATELTNAQSVMRHFKTWKYYGMTMKQWENLTSDERKALQKKRQRVVVASYSQTHKAMRRCDVCHEEYLASYETLSRLHQGYSTKAYCRPCAKVVVEEKARITTKISNRKIRTIYRRLYVK